MNIGSLILKLSQYQRTVTKFYVDLITFVIHECLQFLLLKTFSLIKHAGEAYREKRAGGPYWYRDASRWVDYYSQEWKAFKINKFKFI